jgi:ferric-dicitrate binding protein FerR (iron transport regulator)
LQVRAGAARLLLPAASQVTWSAEEGTAAATLKNGTAMFSTANAKAFALHASTATIRANGDGPTVGSVSIVNPKELRVSCSRGSLAISVEDDTKTIAEGTAYRVVLDPDSVSDDGAAGGGPAAQKRPRMAGRDRFVMYVIIAAGVATGIVLHFALESPDKP